MKDVAPFSVVSSTRAAAPDTRTTSSASPAPAESAEHLLALCQQLIGEAEPERLLQHVFSWAASAGLAESLKFEPEREQATIALGDPRHHSANYRLEVNGVASGTVTVTRRNRYPETALAALECGLGALARALDLAYALQHAKMMATRDSLTGLLNRRALDDGLAREMLLAKRYKRALALMIIDIDHFKEINDQLGHLSGDEALQRLVNCFTGCVRESDMAFRLGGDEFAIILPGTGLVGAAGVARKIQDAVAVLNAARKETIPLRISIGVADMLPGDDDKALLQRADTHLYHAKSLGRDRVCAGV